MINKIKITNKITNKKGISILISYVLLITLAIALAGTTYYFLRTYAEKPFLEQACPDGISIIILNYSYNSTHINMTLKNQGRFNVTGVIINVIANNNLSYKIYTSQNLEKSGQVQVIPMFPINQIRKINNKALNVTSPSSPLSPPPEAIEVVPIRIGKDGYAHVCKNAVFKLPIGACRAC